MIAVIFWHLVENYKGSNIFSFELPTLNLMILKSFVDINLSLQVAQDIIGRRCQIWCTRRPINFAFMWGSAASCWNKKYSIREPDVHDWLSILNRTAAIFLLDYLSRFLFDVQYHVQVQYQNTKTFRTNALLGSSPAHLSF